MDRIGRITPLICRALCVRPDSGQAQGLPLHLPILSIHVKKVFFAPSREKGLDFYVFILPILSIHVKKAFRIYDNSSLATSNLVSPIIQDVLQGFLDWNLGKPASAPSKQGGVAIIVHWRFWPISLRVNFHVDGD